MSKVLSQVMAVAVLAASTGLAACQDQTGVNAGTRTSLSFSANSGKDLLGDPVPAQTPLNIGGHTIVVSSVQLTLSEIEVEGDDSVKTEMKGSTVIVGVPSNGSLTTPVTATLAAGTYTKLEMKVASARIQGTFDGQAFDITVPVAEDLETVISPPLVVTEAGSANVTVSINLSGWFANEDGSAIDPRSLDSSSMSRLRDNIHNSLEAFDDNDHDGRDD